MNFYKEKHPATIQAFKWVGNLEDVEKCGFYIGQVSQDFGSKDLCIENDAGINYTISFGCWIVNENGYIKTMNEDQFLSKYEEIEY